MKQSLHSFCEVTLGRIPIYSALSYTF